MKTTDKLPLWAWIAFGLIGLAVILLICLGVRYYVITHTHSALEPHRTGTWFELAPEDAVCSNGKPLVSRMRVGTENKVLVFFYGGGISLNEYTAARPYVGMTIDIEPGFYAADTDGEIPDWCGVGIGDDVGFNPFRSWSIVVVPYTTGDFHVGDTDYAYTAQDGSEAVLHHHGYDNYRAILDAAMPYLGGDPEELLVAGWSAGGYGAAMLTDDLLRNYFPDAEHVTLCVDSSLLLLDHWKDVLHDVWNAPEALIDRVETSNLIVDFMAWLYETYGDYITFLYIGSVRDGALSRYQSYFDTGFYATDNRFIRVYTERLRAMIGELREKVPGIGIYLFDKLPFSIRPHQFFLTQHTILETNTAFWPLTDRVSVIHWLDSAIGGDVRSHGLYLL